MPKKSDLPAAKRIEAVLAMLRKAEPAVQIARRYEIGEQTLYRWKDEFIAGGSARIEGEDSDQSLSKEMGRLQREIETRERVIGELTIANRILKKLSGPSV